MDLFLTNTQLLASWDVNWWTEVVWIIVTFTFYQMFGLPFWRHPFTAEYPLVSKWCNATFLQILWRKLSDMWPSMVTYTRNSCSAFNPKCTHMQWTHTPWTHTWSSGKPFMLQRRGAVGGSVPCSRAPQSWYWGWRERCTFTSPHLQSLPDGDLNLRNKLIYILNNLRVNHLFE